MTADNEHFKKLQLIISEIMDIDPLDIQPESFLVRELEAESIDLLEIAVDMAAEFGIEIEDEKVFLTRLRVEIESAPSPQEKIRSVYPHLSFDRVEEIPRELADGPVLKCSDLLAYIEFHKGV